MALAEGRWLRYEEQPHAAIKLMLLFSRPGEVPSIWVRIAALILVVLFIPGIASAEPPPPGERAAASEHFLFDLSNSENVILPRLEREQRVRGNFDLPADGEEELTLVSAGQRPAPGRSRVPGLFVRDQQGPGHAVAASPSAPRAPPSPRAFS